MSQERLKKTVLVALALVALVAGAPAPASAGDANIASNLTNAVNNDGYSPPSSEGQLVQVGHTGTELNPPDPYGQLYINFSSNVSENTQNYDDYDKIAPGKYNEAIFMYYYNNEWHTDFLRDNQPIYINNAYDPPVFWDPDFSQYRGDIDPSRIRRYQNESVTRLNEVAPRQIDGRLYDDANIGNQNNLSDSNKTDTQPIFGFIDDSDTRDNLRLLGLGFIGLIALRLVLG